MTKKIEQENLVSNWVKYHKTLINNALKQLIEPLAFNQPTAVSRLIEAMLKASTGGGKKIRPLLTMAAAKALGGNEKDALSAALSIELIHAYSLIHDDLPALDNDDLRRGQPTCHIIYGEALAILTGDALLTMAFQVLTENTNNPSLSLKVIQIISKAAGALGMIGGQCLDMDFEKNPPLDTATVIDMEKRKTGYLIAASLKSGGVLAGASPKEEKILWDAGLLAGEAFQIIDDLLDINGEPELTGKASGQDKKHNKATLPSLLGEKAAKERAELLIKEAIQLIDSFSPNSETLKHILITLFKRKK